jgi:lipopolysaccharide/colanic/teichoic acid biosynthesis glycosyltransferase
LGTEPDSGATNPANGTCCQQSALGLEPMFGVKPPWWKRGMDLAISLTALIITAPLMVIIALFIKAVSAGPVLFCQERVGHLGRIFHLYKFRTMHLGADNSGHRKYMAHLIKGDVPMTKIDSGTDPRLIVGARLLRRTCLDELPQLLNVIKGEMSLIGPRPCLPYEAETFLRWHHRRFDVVPGITGLWQVNGKNKTTFKSLYNNLSKFSLFSSANKHFDESKAPEGLTLTKLGQTIEGLLDKKAGRGKNDGTYTYKTLMVAGMHFMDSYNYDVDRGKRGVIHYSAPEGRLYPFCAYNSGLVFREGIEKKYSCSKAEYRQKQAAKNK